MGTRRIVVAIAAVGVSLVATVGVTLAQMDLEKLKNSTPQERAGVQTLMMSEKLNLTADQKPKVEAINLKYAERMQPVLDGSGGPLMKMRQASELNKPKEAEFKNVLTPEQVQQFLASKEDMREKFEAKMAEKMRAKAGGN